MANPLVFVVKDKGVMPCENSPAFQNILASIIFLPCLVIMPCIIIILPCLVILASMACAPESAHGIGRGRHRARAP